MYLHDTPSRRLFDGSERTFSSGCVRVEGALELVERLLTPAERTAVAERLATGKTQQFNLARPLPIVMAYWTADADALGEIRYRPDVYQLDPPLVRALPR